MDNKAVVSTVALVALGACAGLLWMKFDSSGTQPPPEESPQVAADAPSPTGSAGRAPLRQEMPTVMPPLPEARGRATPMTATPAQLERRAAARRELTTWHPELATRVQLEPAQADALLDLLARQQAELEEAREMHVAADQLRRMELSAQAEQRALLGDKYADWEQFQQDEMSQDPVDRMQAILTAQGNGLDDAELNRMVDALATERARMTRELVESSRSKGRDERELLALQIKRAGTDNRRLVELAARHLTPRQEEVYEKVLAQQVEGMRRRLAAMERAAE